MRRHPHAADSTAVVIPTITQLTCALGGRQFAERQ
jgi:hypothetical protein